MRAKKSTRKLVQVLTAAVALAVPALAFGQGQVYTGRSNDASNRLGSGGYNSGYTDYSYNTRQIINTGNQVITGNITLGREFRGNVGYSDPFSFRGSPEIADVFTGSCYIALSRCRFARCA